MQEDKPKKKKRRPPPPGWKPPRKDYGATGRGKDWRKGHVWEDEFRCTHKHRITGERCKRARVRGSIPARCARHSGFRYNTEDPKNADSFVRIDHLPRFYQRNLKSTLRDKLEEYLDVPREEQLSLFDELALMRAECSRAVEQYDKVAAVIELKADTLTQEQQQKLEAAREQLSSVMRGLVKEVVEVCTAAARVEQMSKGLITPMALALFTNQLIKIIHKRVGDEVTARDIEEDIREIRLEVMTTEERKGTLLLPETDVISMDDSIPAHG